MVDRFADAINQIKTDERIGRDECVLPSTKLMKAVLDLMKRESYIQDYEEFAEGKFKRLRIKLANRINNIGVVKPRFAVSYRAIQKYETRYIPSRDFGVLIVSTPMGVKTNREVRELHVGGRLIAYVY